MSEEMRRPAIEDVPSFYRPYVEILEGDDLLQLLRAGSIRLRELCREMGEERGGHRYEEGKWSVRQVISHLIDSERVFAYRALSIARADATNLPGFDSDNYVVECRADTRSLASLIEELEQLRASTISLFASFAEDVLDRKGRANDVEISVRTLGFIIAGHEAHHTAVLRERYL